MTMVYVLVSYFLGHLLQHYKYILFIEDELDGIYVMYFNEPTAHCAQDW